MARAFRLTEAQYRALSNADDAGFVTAHGRTLAALRSYDLIRPVYRWIQKPAYRHTGVYKSTQSVWGVYGFQITEGGRREVDTENYRRKNRAVYGRA